MQHLRRWLVPLVALSLVAGACGSDREDEASPSSTTEAPAADGSFGDLGVVCGDGEGGDPIKIGYGDDAGYANSPGLNHEMSDAVKAFVAWCNAAGGINGRQIDATYYDAKITEVNNVMVKACEQELFLVGQGFSLDASQEELRRGCELPSVPGFAVSPQHASGPLKYESAPVPGDYTAISHAAHLAELYPEKIKKAGALYANYSATIDSRDKVVEAWPSVGYEFICDQQYNITGEPDWRPIVQRLKDCGAEIIYWSGSPAPNFQNALDAAKQLEYDPVWLADPNAYDNRFKEWNTNGNGDKVYFRSVFTPFEEAGENEATQQYLDIVEADGGDVSLLGQQAAASFLLWAVAARDCGADLTRECVLEKLAATHSWTGGGLHAETDPGGNLPSECGVTLKLTGTTFERVEPKEPNTFDCDPSYAVKLTGPVVQRGKIGPDRISQL